MGTKRKVAVWHRDGRLFVCRPPDWPRGTEYSCTNQNDMIQWAQSHHYVLKDGNAPKGGRYELPHTANA